MRIAIVVPQIFIIHGNRMPLRLANRLSENELDVDVFVHTISASLIHDVKEMIGNAKLKYILETANPQKKLVSFVRSQYGQKYGKMLNRKMIESHEVNAYDYVLLVANEARNIGQLIKKWQSKRKPHTFHVVMELNDHFFLRHSARRFFILKRLLMPFYSLVHHIEYWKLSSFDSILTNSPWTSMILFYLYGIQSELEFVFYDDREFSLPSTSLKEDYIIVPTVALEKFHYDTVRWLHSNGIKLLTYGPNSVKGVPSLGYLPEERMKKVISKARAMLFLFDYEALGLIPIESLALGTPVITIAKEGPYSVLRNNSYVYFPQSEMELLEISISVFSDDWLILNTPKCCNESVSEFRLTKFVDKFKKTLSNS